MNGYPPEKLLQLSADVLSREDVNLLVAHPGNRRIP